MGDTEQHRLNELKVILAKLQVQLAKLDRLNAPIPAIHLDAAIHEIRETLRARQSK